MKVSVQEKKLQQLLSHKDFFLEKQQEYIGKLEPTKVEADDEALKLLEGRDI